VSAQALTYPHFSWQACGTLLLLHRSSDVYFFVAKLLISLAAEPCPQSGQSNAKPDESRI
jgi:hypothetical protein